MTEDQGVREGIVNAYQQLLSEQPSQRVDIEGLHLQHLNFREAEVLELPFTEEKIHSALMEMNGDKAPGPDRFTVAFWQACWDFVKEEIVDLFKEFYDQRSFAKSFGPWGFSTHQPFRGTVQAFSQGAGEQAEEGFRKGGLCGSKCLCKGQTDFGCFAYR